MTIPKIDKQLITDKTSTVVDYIHHYGFVLFLTFLACLYGFVLFRINSLSNVQPSDTAVSSQVKAAAIPKLDQNVINQLQSLQDNSVGVKALFNEARSNPFQ